MVPVPVGNGTSMGKIHLRSNLHQFFLLISHHMDMAISQAVSVTLFIVLTLFPPFLPHSLAPGAITLQLSSFSSHQQGKGILHILEMLRTPDPYWRRGLPAPFFR